MDRVMPTDHSYPSPTSAQVNSGTGPFFNHNGVEQQLPHDLAQLQAASGSHRDHQQSAEHSINPHNPEDYQIQAEAHAADDALRAHHHETLAQHVMNLNTTEHHVHEQIPDDATSRAKRSKVSRACDECRRKKIRCDALETDPNITCSNCRRTGADCKFSRTPMKRGPSKGYIKELADKINTLESRLGPPFPSVQDPAYGAPYSNEFTLNDAVEPPRNDYAPQPVADMGRKRTHSASERGGALYADNPYAPARQPAHAWAQEVPRHLPPLAHQAVGTPQPPGLEAGASGRPQFSPKTGIWKQGPEGESRDSVSMPHEAEKDSGNTVLLQWDEEVVDEYYRIIHQTFPLLPHSKQRLRSRLVACPNTLREAFLVSLDCCVRSSPLSRLPISSASDLRQATRRAAELISKSQYENLARRTLSTDLIYMQTLILMALESDNHGPATMRGQVGPPRAEWLGRAIGMATHLKLNLLQSRERFDGDADADEKIGRRIWWILFILDRWHACSTSCLLQLPEKGFELSQEDQILLGESTWHLARLSFIVGHLAAILTEAPSLMSPASPAGPIINTIILGEIDRFRESVESVLLGSPGLVHLCYWHVRLLIHRLTSSASLHELLVPAVRMASVLNSSHTMITPLNHHFAALSALTLTELMEFDETRAEAEKGLADIEQAMDSRKGFMASEHSTGWDSAIRELVTSTRGESHQSHGNGGAVSGPAAVAGLQHLADVAVGSPGSKQLGSTDLTATSPLPNASGLRTTTQKDRSGAEGHGAYDPTHLTRFGYLTALVQEREGASER